MLSLGRLLLIKTEFQRTYETWCSKLFADKCVYRCVKIMEASVLKIMEGSAVYNWKPLMCQDFLKKISFWSWLSVFVCEQKK